MRTHELTYDYSGSIGWKPINGTVTCRPVQDTSINGIDVIQYRYIINGRDSAISDTSYEYVHVTDTSVINYAWRGDPPYILLKSAAAKDTLKLEVTPYVTFGFSYRLHAQWLTRPDTTRLQSLKEYVGQETLSTPAGTFFCNKVHTDLLIALKSPDLYSDQWSVGNTMVKSYINEGWEVIKDTLGNPIDSTLDWEAFELASAALIDPVSISEGKEPQRVNSGFISKKSSNGYITLNGKKVNGQRKLGNGIYVNKYLGRKSIVRNSVFSIQPGGVQKKRSSGAFSNDENP